MRKFIALAAASMTAMALAAVPASAAPQDTDEGQTVTFTLNGGGLSIAHTGGTTAKTFTAGTLDGVTGPTITGDLYPTTVEDARGLSASWHVRITTAGFTDSTNTHTIGGEQATAYLNVADATALSALLSGGGSSVISTDGAVVIDTANTATVATPATLADDASELEASANTLVAGDTVGTGSITYTPTVSIAIDSDDLAGTYTGVITQSVY